MSQSRGTKAALSDPVTRTPLSIIVTADDFGFGRKTSEGIIQAHLNGPVTATSLMAVTGDHVRSSIPLLEQAPNLDVGLHIVLTHCGEKPLVARASSGLVGRDGNFLTNGQLWVKAFRGKLNQGGVADEIAAQTEVFHKLLGRFPVFVDGHHHVHQLPIIRQAMLQVMDGDLLPRVTRITMEPRQILKRVGGVRLKRRLTHMLGRRAQREFSQRWLWTNQFYFGMLAIGDFDREFPWEKYIKRLPDVGVVEWVVHPGMADDTLEGRDSYTAQRVKELESLTSPACQKYWEHLRPMLSRKSILKRLPDPM